MRKGSVVRVGARTRQIAWCGGMAVSLVVAAAGCSDSNNDSPTAPSPGATVASVAVTGAAAFAERGATAQFRATATLSDGTDEDRTPTATWQSDNTSVATVSSQGLVTAENEGEATISATVASVRGTRVVSVSVSPGNRTPDPAAGQQLPLPDIQAFVQQASNERPELLAQSCPNPKYVNNPWLDYIVDRLRTVDTRWGYNAKPTRTAADNDGMPVIAAGDEVAYHYGAGPDEGATDVYLIDLLEGHCGPTPRVTYRVFTGEEPGRWTGAGRF